jgi:hypothetical protein
MFFAPAWILFEDRKLHPYLNDRSINDLQFPVKNNTSDKAGALQPRRKSGTQKLQEFRSYRMGVIFGARVNTVHLRI